MKKGDAVTLVDRYAQRRSCTCKAPDPSWFDGLRGVITECRPRGAVMVHLESERLPMLFDVRDVVVAEHPSAVSMTGAE